MMLLAPMLGALLLSPVQEKPAPLPEPYLSIETKALAGDTDAALEIARDFDAGDGVPKDPTRAYALFLKAASTGSMDGLEQTGYHELNGIGTEKDTAKALESFRKATLLGSGYAAQEIGWMYEKGIGVLQNDQMAVQWYQQAIQKGHFEACGALGWLTENGRGTPKDDTLAAKLYFMGASHGDDISQDNLGWLCVEGRGVTGKNYELAMTLFQESAKQGNARAEGNIGYLYEHGLGVPADDAKSMDWFKRSADHGDLKSQEFMAGKCIARPNGVMDSEMHHYALLSARQGSTQGLTFLTIALISADGHPSEALKASFPVLKEAAERGNKAAFAGLGVCYLQGNGVAADRAEARAWLLKAAAPDGTPSMLPPICNGLSQGALGFPKDPALAADLLEIAAKGGNTFAAIEAADMDPVPAKSLKRLEVLAAGGNSEAEYRLGLRYQNGDRAPLSASKALACFESAASKGNASAMYHLGVLYQAGILVKPDPKMAAEWYTKAEAAHFPPAASRFNPDGSLAPLPTMNPPSGKKGKASQRMVVDTVTVVAKP